MSPLASSTPQISLIELVRQTQAGDSDSARELYDRCREPLLFVIRRFMSPPLRRLFDSDDLLVEAFADVCKKHFTDNVLKSSETLWQYLKMMARNKVVDAHRKFLGRGILSELSLDDPEVKTQLVSRNLSPIDVLCLHEVVTEWWDAFVSQEPLVFQCVIRRWAQGEGVSGISVQLGISLRQVYRALQDNCVL